MYQAKYAHRNQKRRLRWKKPFVLAMSVVILLLGMVSGSVAYLVASEDPLKNVFIPGEVKIEIDQNDSAGTKAYAKIQNCGNTDAYIRAMAVITWQDETGKIYPRMPQEGVDYSITWNRTGWSEPAAGEYFHTYNGKVSPGLWTENLFTDCTPVESALPEGCHLVVDVIAEAVQADANGLAAWSREGGQ